MSKRLSPSLGVPTTTQPRLRGRHVLEGQSQGMRSHPTPLPHTTGGENAHGSGTAQKPGSRQRVRGNQPTRQVGGRSVSLLPLCTDPRGTRRLVSFTPLLSLRGTKDQRPSGPRPRSHSQVSGLGVSGLQRACVPCSELCQRLTALSSGRLSAPLPPSDMTQALDFLNAACTCLPATILLVFAH